LNRTFGCVRKVWNLTLQWRRHRWDQNKQPTNMAQANAFLTALKREPDYAYLTEVSSVPLQQVLRTQHTAFANFFAKRACHPRRKTRLGRQSAEYTRSAFRWRDGQLWLAKMDAPIRLVWSWLAIDPTTLDPSTVTISCDPDGRWYASLSCDISVPAPFTVTGSAVGVDMGLKDFAVCSDGTRVTNPRLLARKARNLARYQRRMARKQKGSGNRVKARRKVARAHRKVKAARRDFLHRTSTNLVRHHDVIVIEDLNVTGMVRNRRVARAISDAGWGELRRQLEYKCARYGRALVVIDRWYPSTKTCSSCGFLLDELKLSARHWTCPGCGTPHDRDLNAAKNILAAGLAVTACGDGVRHPGPSVVRPSAKQETPTREGGNPLNRGRSQ